MEGSIFIAGAAVKWLRDGLGLIGDVTETAALATQVPDSHGVYMVPAFVGLGAPHWVPEARGLLCGLTLDTTSGASRPRGSRVRRVPDPGPDGARWRADGAQPRGNDPSRRRHGRQRLVLPVPGRCASMRPWSGRSELETTALGAAFLAGLATGVWT